MRIPTCAFLVAGILVLLVFFTGCTSEPEEPAPVTGTTATTTTRSTTVPTPTPIKETVYVYVTVTVTVTPTSAEPVLTKDPGTAYDLPVYNAWRYQSTSKSDGITTFGPVHKLLLHLDKAPTKDQYTLYYQSGKQWILDLEGLIDEVKTTSPPIRSVPLNRSINSYTANLTLQNETIRILDWQLTNWEFEDAWRQSRGVVFNISNATIVLDREVSALTGT